MDRDVFFELLLHTRVKDGGLDRLLHEWFEAGVLDDDELSYSDKGTPQGGGVTPLLANIVLNELDTYVEDRLIPEDSR